MTHAKELLASFVLKGKSSAMSSSPHSAEQFGEQRDFWWNRDFLDLMAARWRLKDATSLADIGCGLCHWSRLLYPYFKFHARFAGVDREARWVTDGAQQFQKSFPEVPTDLLTFVQGDATAIPLPDNSFDVVTCQTVLMHLALPLDALREMIRILRPGGLLVCVEPNNLWNFMAFTSLTANESVEVLVRRFEFWLRYHRGKIAAGQGDHCIGNLLPGYFAQLGLSELKVYQSDRVASLFPPYETPAQCALIEQTEQWKNHLLQPENQKEMQSQVMRGGGTTEFFEHGFVEIMENHAQENEAIDAGEFHAAYGGLTYLVSGRKR